MNVPTGVDCPNRRCDAWIDFVPYVYAHWTNELACTCESCGRRFIVKRGLVIVKNAGRGDEK